MAREREKKFLDDVRRINKIWVAGSLSVELQVAESVWNWAETSLNLDPPPQKKKKNHPVKSCFEKASRI